MEYHIYSENVNTFLREPLSAESPVQRRADTAGNVPPTTQTRRPRQSHLAFADAVFCYAFGIAPVAGGFVYSWRMASSALILTARLAGKMPAARPMTVENTSASATSQAGTTETADPPPM